MVTPTSITVAAPTSAAAATTQRNAAHRALTLRSQGRVAAVGSRTVETAGGQEDEASQAWHPYGPAGALDTSFMRPTFSAIA